MTERKRDKLDHEFRTQRKNAYPSKEQEAKHLAALAKLHHEFTHLRTCKQLNLTNETGIHWSETIGKYILCGMSYSAYTRKGDRLKIEILHLEADWFRLFVVAFTRPYDQKVVAFDCKLKFKHLAKFIAFSIPILKDD